VYIKISTWNTKWIKITNSAPNTDKNHEKKTDFFPNILRMRIFLSKLFRPFWQKHFHFLWFLSVQQPVLPGVNPVPLLAIIYFAQPWDALYKFLSRKNVSLNYWNNDLLLAMYTSHTVYFCFIVASIIHWEKSCKYFGGKSVFS